MANKTEWVTSAEFREKHGTKRARSTKNFDGEAAIRARLTAMKIPFREQVEFAPPRKYRADFLIIGEEFPIILEYSGGVWSRGKSGHNSGGGLERDAEKLNLATVQGFQYLTFTERLLRRPLYFETTIKALVGQ